MEASRQSRAAFAVLTGAYYALYYVIFSRQVGEYLHDVLRHFEFVRRLFPS